MRNNFRSFLLVIIITPFLFAQPQLHWAHRYHEHNDLQDWICDIYVTEDGGYACCGMTYSQQNSSDFWLLKTDDRGELEFSHAYTEMEGGVGEKGNSLIQTDDGGYVIGGHSRTNGWDMLVVRTDEVGEQIWMNRYGGDDWEECNAVIELKNGNFLLAGVTSSFGAGEYDGWLVCIDGDGDVIWDATHGTDQRESFYAMREVNDGVMVAGRRWQHRGDRDYWLVRVDEEGEMIWERTYGSANIREDLMDMTSCRNGGFILAGWSINYLPFIVRVNMQGEVLWDGYYEDDNINVGPNCGSIAQLTDNGFAYAAWGNGGITIVLRLDSAGNFQWRYYSNYGADGSSFFRSVLAVPDGGIIAGGSLWTREDNDEGLLVQLHPDRSPPHIISYVPDSLEFTVLQNDTVDFSVQAIDVQGDSILYFWTMDGDSSGTDSSTSIVFPEIGDFTVRCVVSDGELADSVQWLVHVCEFYITGYSPDSLNMTVRRNSSIDFTLDIAAIEDIELNYLWTLTDRNQRREEVGETDSVSVCFDLTGDYWLKGFVWRGEESDEVNWNIHVRSAVWYWWPREDSLTVSVDSTILFAITPFNPDSDSLEYLWMLDGDTIDFEQEIEILFEEMGLHEVVAYVNDGREADTIYWNVNVIPLESTPELSGIITPQTPVLFSPVPNPVNSYATISYFLPVQGRISLKVYSTSGQSVSTLFEGWRTPGTFHCGLRAGDLPAGIYLVSLEINNMVKTRKLVVVK